MTKADFRSIKRKAIRAFNKGRKVVQRGNKRGLAYIDQRAAAYCVHRMRLRDCAALV
jgi:hypothetical protein